MGSTAAMTPRERFLSVLRGQPVDRIPLDMQGFNNHYSPAVEGWYGFPSYAEVRQNSDPGYEEIAARVEDKCIAQYHVPSWANRYLVTPRQWIHETTVGRKGDRVRYVREIDTPKGKLRGVVERSSESVGTIWTVKNPVESEEDIEKIRSIPWELPEGLDVANVESLGPDRYGRRVLYTYVTSPAICVAGMMDFQAFLMMCATDLPLIEELTGECLRRELQILDVLLAGPGIDVVWIGGSEWLTPPLASPATYESLVQRQETRLIERIHAAGALAHVHCHGNVRETLGLTIARGADYFEPVEPPPDGDITFAEAKEMVDGALVLGGNIELALLEEGSEQEVEKAVKEAFRRRRQSMVLATSAASNQPVFSRNALRNYHRLVDLWEELSTL